MKYFRSTHNNVRDLMEAYHNVYYKEQNEFSDWVDGLLNEGYNLSQTTWRELAEYYVQELDQQQLFEELVSFCYNENIFNTLSESIEYVDSLFNQALVYDFIEEFHEEINYYISKNSQQINESTATSLISGGLKSLEGLGDMLRLGTKGAEETTAIVKATPGAIVKGAEEGGQLTKATQATTTAIKPNTTTAITKYKPPGPGPAPTRLKPGVDYDIVNDPKNWKGEQIIDVPLKQPRLPPGKPTATRPQLPPGKPPATQTQTLTKGGRPPLGPPVAVGTLMALRGGPPQPPTNGGRVPAIPPGMVPPVASPARRSGEAIVGSATRPGGLNANDPEVQKHARVVNQKGGMTIATGPDAGKKGYLAFKTDPKTGKKTMILKAAPEAKFKQSEDLGARFSRWSGLGGQREQDVKDLAAFKAKLKADQDRAAKNRQTYLGGGRDATAGFKQDLTGPNTAKYMAPGRKLYGISTGGGGAIKKSK